MNKNYNNQNRRKNLNTKLPPVDGDRRIYLFGEINERNTTTTIRKLEKLDSVSHDDIELVINSVGGFTQQAFALIDTMKYRISSDIRTTVVGNALSAGFLISIAGCRGKRSATLNSILMMHLSERNGSGNIYQFYNAIDELNKYDMMIAKHIAINTKRSVNKIYKLMERDFFFEPESALKFRAIDFIISNEKYK